MNRENVLYCIQLMKQAKNLNMEEWQADLDSGDGDICETVEELHSCGNTACFAGYVALSEKFQQDGGIVHGNGAPLYKNELEVHAICEWLDIDLLTARKIVFGHSYAGVGLEGSEFSDVYQKEWESVTPDDVIKQLQNLLDGEL